MTAEPSQSVPSQAAIDAAGEIYAHALADPDTARQVLAARERYLAEQAQATQPDTDRRSA